MSSSRSVLARRLCSCSPSVRSAGTFRLFRAANPQLAGTRISYEFEVLYTLPEVIEDDDAAPEQNCAFASSKVAAWNRSCCLRAART